MQTSETYQLIPEKTPLVILAEGCFGTEESKTAIGVIRYGNWPINAIVDSSQAGKYARDLIGGHYLIPILGSLSEALSRYPRTKGLLIGIAPIGGELPEAYKAIAHDAVDAGLHIINGLHTFLRKDAKLSRLAKKRKVILWDVRAAKYDNIVAHQLPRPPSTRVIATVGSDCSVGKMSVAWEIYQALCRRGTAADFVATGQTGIIISGSGIPLDRIVGDFMAGSLERLIEERIKRNNPKWLIVEGQGSLLHPAYSGVTLALLHGAAPDAMIFCCVPSRSTIQYYDRVKLPQLREMIQLYEQIVRWIKPARVLGVALNTSDFNVDRARELVAMVQRQTGIPATDPLRFGVEPLVNALIAHFGIDTG